MAKKKEGEGRQTGKKDEFSYTITDPTFGELRVLNSANAWWNERAKVELLIAACKLDATVEECCTMAGITLDQYKYFYELHPNFSTIKDACNQIPSLTARKTIVDSLAVSPANSQWYLTKKKKKEFGETRDITSGGEPLVIRFDDAFLAKPKDES